MRWKSYPAYRDSGVEWIGEVPVDWDNWKVTHAFNSLGSGTTPPSNEPEWYEDGTIPWVTTGELRENCITETAKMVTPSALEKFTALRLHQAGSLVMAMYGATIGRLGILAVDATSNQACCVLSDPIHLDVKFSFYWLIGFKKQIIELFATGGGQPNINQETVAGLRIPAPRIEEQTAIATFLDRETAKLDTLISKQERLIELLQEKRQAVISHAVIKGLDPDVPMKDSGIEWLGAIPYKWMHASLRHVCKKITDGSHFSPENTDEGRSYVTVRNLISSEIDLDGAAKISEIDFEKLVKAGCRPSVNDVLFSKDGTVGKVAIVKNNNFVALSSLAIISPNHEVLYSKYLYYFLHAHNGEKQVESLYAGAALKRITLDAIVGIYIPVPSINEQEMIASYLDQETTKIELLINKARQSIDLAKEHRSALISAAVTGKIDVREAA